MADDMTGLSSQELMRICDGFWTPATESYGRYVSAANELVTRGPEIRDWCRRLLVHPDYYARETGAFLLGELGKRRLLGEVEAAVVEELGSLTRRPVEDDGKELQAVDAAISALGEIGHLRGITFLRDVLFSDGERLGGDSQWAAADALGRLVGEPFIDSPDPVEAARRWLNGHMAPDPRPP